MRVIWQTIAKRQRDIIAEYIRQEFGAKRRNLFLQEVRKTTRMLSRSPNIGSIDSLFSERPIAYRSVIINGLSKLVYRIDNEVIHIVAFWDTRQEPESQAAKIKE